MMRMAFDLVFSEDQHRGLLGKRVLRLSSGSVSTIRALSDAEWIAYKGAIDQIRAFQKSDELLDASDRTFDEFADAYQLMRSSDGEASERRVSHSDASELNRRLANYLSAMRLYLDFTRSRLSRQYGKTSGELHTFSGACATEYDTHFSYRFAYKLRNYSQHFGYPIGHITHTESLEAGDLHRSDTRVAFDMHGLEATGGDLWGPLRAEMRDGPALVDIAQLIDAVPTHLRTIRNAATLGERAALLATQRIFEHTLGHDFVPEGPLTVGEFLQDNALLGLEIYRPIRVHLPESEAVADQTR